MHFIDLHFLGLRHVIGTAVLQGPSGLTLDRSRADVLPAGTRERAARPRAAARRRAGDPADAHPSRSCRRDWHAARAAAARGCSTCTSAARRTWSIRRSCWRARRGSTAPNMDRFWGEFRPVPADRTEGAERRRTARRRRPHTRGRVHAGTRLAPRELPRSRDRQAFVGDTAGIRVAEAATSRRRRRRPTSISSSGRRASRSIESWRPSSLVLTHFGVVDEPAEHLRQFRGVLARQAAFVRATLARRDRRRAHPPVHRGHARRRPSGAVGGRCEVDGSGRGRSISCGWDWRATGENELALRSGDLAIWRSGDLSEPA